MKLTATSILCFLSLTCASHRLGGEPNSDQGEWNDFSTRYVAELLGDRKGKLNFFSRAEKCMTSFE